MFRNFILFALFIVSAVFADNQTSTVSEVYPSDDLPFQIVIEQEDFILPNGLHSFASANYNGKWLIIGGRTNGLHDFNNNNNNFPPQQQNTYVYVIDPRTKQVWTKSLADPTSNLTQDQIDTLSVTSPQSYQWERYLYISGGYGVDTNTGLFSTKSCFTAVDIPGLINWVINPHLYDTAAAHIKQVFDSFFQVTGGHMARVDSEHSLLIFGQNFDGYYVPGSNGEYTKQVRVFSVSCDATTLKVTIIGGTEPHESQRRRDLNVIPVVSKHNDTAFVALSGVFTETGGDWTVPVLIAPDGTTSMKDPDASDTFKQAMNNYASANVGLYSQIHEKMYSVLLGGISYGYFDNGTFTTDPEFPFINQVTTIQIDKDNNFKQFLMEGQYPVILSTESNPGNTLLFGAGAKFFTSNLIQCYNNGVIRFDNFWTEPAIIGYIVGGIQSTLPNTNSGSDSAASPYIFKVTLVPRR